MGGYDQTIKRETERERDNNNKVRKNSTGKAERERFYTTMDQTKFFGLQMAALDGWWRLVEIRRFWEGFTLA